MTGSALPIQWESNGGAINPNFRGYVAAHYCTGNPELGWCLYVRDAACWNQRTKPAHPPVAGMIPERINGQWVWTDPSSQNVTTLAHADENQSNQ